MSDKKRTIIELFPDGRAPKKLGTKPAKRGITVRDLAFLARLFERGIEVPTVPRRNERGAAERLRRARFLYRREGAEEQGYLLSSRGIDLLATVLGAIEKEASREQ